MFMIALAIFILATGIGVYYLNTSGIEATPVIDSSTLNLDKINEEGLTQLFNTSKPINDTLVNQTILTEYSNPFMENANPYINFFGDIFYKMELAIIDYINSLGLNVTHILFVVVCIVGSLFLIYFLITFASNKISSFAKIFILIAIAVLIIFIVYNGGNL